MGVERPRRRLRGLRTLQPPRSTGGAPTIFEQRPSLGRSRATPTRSGHGSLLQLVQLLNRSFGGNFEGGGGGTQGRRDRRPSHVPTTARIPELGAVSPSRRPRSSLPADRHESVNVESPKTDQGRQEERAKAPHAREVVIPLVQPRATSSYVVGRPSSQSRTHARPVRERSRTPDSDCETTPLQAHPLQTSRDASNVCQCAVLRGCLSEMLHVLKPKGRCPVPGRDPGSRHERGRRGLRGAAVVEGRRRYPYPLRRVRSRCTIESSYQTLATTDLASALNFVSVDGALVVRMSMFTTWLPTTRR